MVWIAKNPWNDDTATEYCVKSSDTIPIDSTVPHSRRIGAMLSANDDIPALVIPPNVLLPALKSVFVGGIDSFFFITINAIIAPTICANTVARAAPTRFAPNRLTRMKSPPMLTNRATRLNHIAQCALPSILRMNTDDIRIMNGIAPSACICK